MKELIPMDELGVFCDMKDTVRVDSRFVAEFFEKEHKHVMRDIRRITDERSGLSDDFRRSNFGPTSFTDCFGRKQPCYQMTRDGFTMLVMGYTGTKAMQFKELYIKRFNEMEAQIKWIQDMRQEYPEITAQIKMLYPNAEPYIYSNEADMLNRLALGMTAKQFREKHGLQKSDPIRPHMTKQELKRVDMLQHADYGVLIAVPEYQRRKYLLEKFADEHFVGELALTEAV